MVVDSSAVLAILLDEPERRWFEPLLAKAASRLLSAASLVESSIVLDSRHRQRAAAELDALLGLVDIDVVPVDLNQAEIARAAFRRYGCGRHPAGLNFGDCFSYALAKATGEPLLFKGTDFGLTDVTPAYRP